MQEPGPHTSSSNFALWNPNAAANWSLLFTPAFGAYLHAQNWRAMGEQDRASASMRWLFVGLALLAVYFLVGIFGEEEKTIRQSSILELPEAMFVPNGERSIDTSFCARKNMKRRLKSIKSIL